MGNDVLTKHKARASAPHTRYREGLLHSEVPHRATAAKVNSASWKEDSASCKKPAFATLLFLKIASSLPLPIYLPDTRSLDCGLACLSDASDECYAFQHISSAA